MRTIFVAELDKVDVIVVPNVTIDAIADIIRHCDNNKIMAIKMLRNLQINPLKWGTGEPALPLKEAKDLVEFAAACKFLTFKSQL